MEEWQKVVGVVSDEVRIKHTGHILGYTDLGSINYETYKLEQLDKQPTSMLVFMV